MRMRNLRSTSGEGDKMIKVIANKEYIFEGDQQEFRSSHASTVVVMPGGEVLAAWFRRESMRNQVIQRSGCPAEIARAGLLLSKSPMKMELRIGILSYIQMEIHFFSSTRSVMK